MTLLASGTWYTNMLISGFILGTVIFGLFLWQAIQNYISVKQINRFKDKTKNIFKDRYAEVAIYSIEIFICVLWVLELAFFIAAEILLGKYGSEGHTHGSKVAGAIAVTSNIIFLVNAVMIISYMAIANLWNASLIVVVDQDNLITSTAVASRRDVTVSRVLKAPHIFKITYRDNNLKGNLKEVRLRYSKKMDMFLSRNGFYKGDKDD